MIDVSYHIAQYQQIIQDLRNQVQLLRDQKDDLEVRISTTNEARFSRLSGESKILELSFVCQCIDVVNIQRMNRSRERSLNTGIA